MKIYFTLLISFFTFSIIGAQQSIWHTEVHYDDIQIRLPLATVLAKLDVELPGDGQVFVRFDGYFTSSPGDRIVLAASNTESWTTNDGNIGLLAYTTNNNSQSFSHQRVYTITAGKQSYYAIGHNFVDTDGTGIASIHGNLTVEFFPATSGEHVFTGQGILKYPVILNEDAQVISSLEINVPVKGKVLVNFTSAVYSLSNNDIEISLSDSELWPIDANASKSNIVNTYAVRYITTTKIFEVQAGSHEFFSLARKTKGDFTNPNNAFYASMTLQFFPEEGEKNILVSDHVEAGTISINTPVSLLSKVSIDAPSSGQVVLNASGKFATDIQGRILMKISDLGVAEISNPDLKVQKLHEGHGDEYFSTTKVFRIEQGKNEFYLYGSYDDSVFSLMDGSVTSNFTLKYIADPIISSIDHTELNKTKFDIFPNPTAGNLYFKSNDISSEKSLNITMYDLKGNVVKNNIHNTCQSIDISELIDGVYILKLMTEGQTFTQKIMKTH